MKFFPLLRTRRLAVQLKELSIGDSIALAGMPEHLEQAECTAFLRYAIDTVQNGPSDPAEWTAQERMLAVGHYLASILDDGPNFALGDDSHYLDYLDSEHDIGTMTPIFVGELGGDRWLIRHITGVMAESIERLSAEFEGINPQSHWLFGAMAAQLIREGEDFPEMTDSGLFDEWLENRIHVLLSFPSSDFEQLLFYFYAGREKLYHLFSIDFSEDGGLLANAKGGAGDLPPARFPVRKCVSVIAQSMAGKPVRAGNES